MLDFLPLYVLGGILLVLYFLFLRPRRGGKDAPPLVLNSPALPGPLGMAFEFGKSPVKMIRRCYDLYGGVFTVPVCISNAKDQFPSAFHAVEKRHFYANLKRQKHSDALTSFS